MPTTVLSRRRLLLAATLAVAVMLPGLVASNAIADEPKQEASVALVIDFGDGVQKRITLPWSKEMTVADALEAAAAARRAA